MRTLIALLALLIATLLIACGAPTTNQHDPDNDTIAALAATATDIPPTATPTDTPQPTATITPEPTVTSTPTPTPLPTAVPPEPVRIQIPDINLDYATVAVGLDQQNLPVVLDHDVAWFNLSAKPGQGDNIVFWGHVLRFKATPRIPAPFEHVHELQPSAIILLTSADGQQRRYAVSQQIQVQPDEVHYILPTGNEQVTIVSCIGDKVSRNGVVTKTERLVTIATPVEDVATR